MEEEGRLINVWGEILFISIAVHLLHSLHWSQMNVKQMETTTCYDPKTLIGLFLFKSPYGANRSFTGLDSLALSQMGF